jgi:chromosome partitioning protein
MKVITLLNEKGGVGKTTLSTHIAAGLAIRGLRVVFVDADPQANSTKVFGLPKAPHFHDLIVRGKAWAEALQLVHPDVYGEPHRVPAGQLLVVAGDKESRTIPLNISDPRVVRIRFNELRKHVDYIIVDTPPTPSLLHAAIVAASDFIIAPTDCEAFSALDGLHETVQSAGQVYKATGQKTGQVIGIVPNRYNAKTIVHTEVLQHLRKTYGDLVWPEINQATIIARAQLERQFLFGYAPESRATGQMWELIDRIWEAIHERQES